MISRRIVPLALIVPFLTIVIPAVRGADPTDNPIATFYSGPEGYPAWTDHVSWNRVINMKTYPKGKTAFEKFDNARKELAEGGGVMYYPAGTYDFTTIPAGVPMSLNSGVVIRGEAPNEKQLASSGKMELPTKFKFGFRERAGGSVPRDFNFIGVQLDDFKNIKSTNTVGIAWVHLHGATINWGPQLDWTGKSWAKSTSPLSDKLKTGWGLRDPSGTHPFDAFVSGGKMYKGAGSAKFVFGCVLDDAVVLDDYLDPGYGPNGFEPSPQCARLIAYGSKILVANTLIPRSKKNFKHPQKTSGKGKSDGTVLFDYGNECGIDINKDMLAPASANGTCPGYFEEGVVVRDNYVFNHGHKGYSISGNWVTITGNRNERIYMKKGEDVYGLGTGWAMTQDGYEQSVATSDNMCRAFELAGRNLWVDGNKFNNTGSSPGADGEGIICLPKNGTQIFSWAITHNIHTKGAGAPGSMGGSDADCHGLLVAWNQTPGWVGNSIKRNDVKMTDCSFVANKAASVVPDDKTIAKLGLPAPVKMSPANPPKPPTKVTAAIYKDDAVKITWSEASEDEVGFRVDRKIGEGKWHPIAYRPPQVQSDAENPQEWVDFTAPSKKLLMYRVVAIGSDDTDKGASEATSPLTLLIK
jgi:hypothetical protein